MKATIPIDDSPAMIVTIFPDNGEKYLGERFWEETPEADGDEAGAPALARLNPKREGSS